MEAAAQVITVVWYNYKTQKCGMNPYVDKRFVTTPGAVFVDNDAHPYTVTYYNDPQKVAFCMLKEE